MAAKCRYKKPYVDSSVIIAWLKGEEGRRDVFTDILIAAEAGAFKVYTSTVTIAEVHRPRRHQQGTEKDSDQLLDLFEQDFLVFIDVDRRVAERAHRLCRDTGLRPFDALHVASALRANCEVLLSWDDRFDGLGIADIAFERPQFVAGQGTLIEQPPPST